MRPFVHQIRCYDSVFFEEAVLMVADWMDASEMAKRFTTSKNFVIDLNNKTNKELIYSLNLLSWGGAFVPTQEKKKNYKKFGFR